MWNTVNVPFNFLLTFQKRFTALQKCILLSLVTVTVGAVAGCWIPVLVFHGSLSISVLIARHLLARETNLNVIPHLLTVRRIISAKRELFWNLFRADDDAEDGQPLYSRRVKKCEASVPEVEVSQCLKYIYRDFVQSWYGYISDEEVFLDEAEVILEEISLLLVNRVKLVDIHSVLPDYVVLMRKHIVDFQEAMKHLDTQPNYKRKKDRTKEFKKVKNVVESFNRLGKFHIAVKNDGELELVYLRVLMETVLKIFMPVNLHRCTAARELVLEVLTCQILGKVVDMFSDPDFLHKVIVLVLTNDALIEPGSETQDTNNSNSLTNTPDVDKTNIPNHVGSVPESVHSISGLDAPPKVLDSQLDPEGRNIETNQIQVIITDSHQPGDLIDKSGKQLEGTEESPGYVSNSGVNHTIPVSNSDETQVKTTPDTSPLTDDAGGPSQRMYVSETLSKHFRVSASGINDMRAVDGNVNLLPKAVGQDCTNRSQSNSPSPPGHLLLPLTQNSATRQFDRSPSTDTEELHFVPSFFLPGSDDEISLYSNSSEMNTDGVSVCSESSRDSRSMSPVKPDGTVPCGRDVASQQELPEFPTAKHKIDVTDGAHVINGARNNARMPSPVDHVMQKHNSLVRNNSAGLLISQRAELIQSNVGQGYGALRKVASCDAFIVTGRRTSPPTSMPNSVPSQFTEARPSVTNHGQDQPLRTEGHVEKHLQGQYQNQRDQIQTQSHSQIQGCSHLQVHPQSQVKDDLAYSSQVAASVPPRPGSQSVLTESCTEGPVEDSCQDMPVYLFQDVYIYSTEKIKDPSGSTYTIYLIKYRAWHLEDDVWYLRSSRANRRYREFITLQERLEEHPIYKKKIKDINGPHRWKVLPFGQIEIHGIEARRKFLEGYLQTLIVRDQVGNSLAIREFLAYEGDAHIAFVKKAHEVPRIDKMIAKTFSGVFNKLTTRPPSHYYTEGDNPGHYAGSARGRIGDVRPRGEHKVDGIVEDRDRDDLSLDYTYSHNDQMEIQTMENMLSRHIHEVQQTSPPSFYNTTDEDTGSEDTEGFKDAIESSFTMSHGGKVHKGPVGPFPLTSAILDIAIELVNGRNSWFVRDNVMTCLKVTAGEALDSFLHDKIRGLTTCDEMARYIRLLMDTLWPGGELNTTKAATRTDKQKDVTRDQAKKALGDFLPALLPVVIGQEDYNHAVEHVMEVIDHETLNRHLVFSILDAAIETLLPEVCTRELQYHLLAGVAGDTPLR